MTALQELLALGDDNPNAAVEQWASAGRKVLGYWCSYIPPEIIYAAGFLPYRVRGSGARGTEKADRDMTPVCNCSFPRAVLDLAYRGQYGFLDGIVGMNGCDHSRRAFELWVERLRPPYHHFVYVPRTRKEVSLNEYVRELDKFKVSIERHFRLTIGPEALQGAVDLFNDNRSLLKKVQELFRQDRPPLTGTERHRIINASVAIPPERLNALLRALLEELKFVEGQRDFKTRIMIVGWVGDDTLLHRMIEDSRGLVVMDNCCFGARAYWNPVVLDPGDALGSLARSYLGRTGCPRMFATFDERYGMLMQGVKDYRVDGIVRTRLQFCDLHGVENVFIHKRKDQAGVPMSAPIVLDYVGQDEGRVRTRMEAFIEQLQH